MAQTSHGIGGLTFDASRRNWPPEVGVFIALVLIVIVFEVLGRLIMGDSFLFNTRENVEGIFNQARLQIIILQVSIIGIIALGVTQVILSGGIDLSSGSVVGAAAMIAMSFAQIGEINGIENTRAVFFDQGWVDLPVIVPVVVALACGLVAGVINGLAYRLYRDSALHRHPRHDGDGPRPRQVVDGRPAGVVPDRELCHDRRGHDAGLHLRLPRDPLPLRPALHRLRQAHLRHRLERGGGADVRHQGRTAQGAGLHDRGSARRRGGAGPELEEPHGAGRDGA